MRKERGKTISARARRSLGIAVTGLDHLAQLLGLQVKWKDLRVALSGSFALLRLGPWGVGAFVLLVCGLAGFGTVVFAGEGERPGILRGPVAQALLGAIAAFAFALLNAEARPAHPALRFGVALYTLWYQLLPPVLALPRVVALVPAFALYAVEVLRLRTDRARPLWLLPWVLLLGRLSPVVVRPVWVSVGLWAALYAGLGATLYRRPPPFPIPERAVLFTGMAIAYGAGIIRNLAGFGQALQMGYSALFTFLGLFWMWLAADLVDDAAELAGRVVGRFRKSLARRRLPSVVASVLVATGLMALALALVPAAVLDPLPPVLMYPLVGFLRDAWTEGLALLALCCWWSASRPAGEASEDRTLWTRPPTGWPRGWSLPWCTGEVHRRGRSSRRSKHLRGGGRCCSLRLPSSWRSSSRPPRACGVRGDRCSWQPSRSWVLRPRASSSPRIPGPQSGTRPSTRFSG